MLRITIPAREYYDEENDEFISVKETTLQLEHSLVSIAKWEAKWRKAFLGKREKTEEEILDYIRCMTISQNINPMVYMGLTSKNIEEINNYISEPMTSIYFYDEIEKNNSNDVITSEVIYWWMITLNIPFECQKWHLNRLLSLIRVCNIKNSSDKKKSKMSEAEIMHRNARLNEARKKKLNTNG